MNKTQRREGTRCLLTASLLQSAFVFPSHHLVSTQLPGLHLGRNKSCGHISLFFLLEFFATLNTEHWIILANIYPKFIIPGSLLRSFHFLSQWSSKQPYEEGVIINQNLQRKKGRHREAEQLAQGHTGSGGARNCMWTFISKAPGRTSWKEGKVFRSLMQTLKGKLLGVKVVECFHMYKTEIFKRGSWWILVCFVVRWNRWLMRPCPSFW